MTRKLKNLILHDLFEAGVLIKAINSIWEILGGIFLLTMLRSWLTRIFIVFSQSQLLGDHDDLLFRAVNEQAHHLANVHTRTFVGIYLLFHGLMNAFLAYNLYRNRLWAYPVMIGFISIFFVYQVYRLYHTHSAILLLVSAFDLAFIYLTWHEYVYQKVRAQRALEPGAASDSKR
jgi:uncharacterized membrane protein